MDGPGQASLSPVKALASPLTRVALVVVAVVVVCSVASSRGDRETCGEAGAQLLRSLKPGQPEDASRQARATLLEDRCTDSGPLLASASVLADADRPAEALPLARKVVRHEPDNAAAWLTLSKALRASDPPRARAAVSRARELNPLAVAPQRR